MEYGLDEKGISYLMCLGIHILERTENISKIFEEYSKDRVISHDEYSNLLESTNEFMKEIDSKITGVSVIGDASSKIASDTLHELDESAEEDSYTTYIPVSTGKTTILVPNTHYTYDFYPGKAKKALELLERSITAYNEEITGLQHTPEYFKEKHFKGLSGKNELRKSIVKFKQTNKHMQESATYLEDNLGRLGDEEGYDAVRELMGSIEDLSETAKDVKEFLIYIKDSASKFVKTCSKEMSGSGEIELKKWYEFWKRKPVYKAVKQFKRAVNSV